MAGKNRGKGGGGGGKGAPASGKGAKTSNNLATGVAVGLGGLLVALVAQSFLTTLPTPPKPPGSGQHGRRTASGATPAAEPEVQLSGPPAVCPDDWAACPRVPGADWVALAELEASGKAVVDDAAIEACRGPKPLLSVQAVPGMHLLCVLPPPAGEESRVSATIAAFELMQRREVPSKVLLLPRLASADEVVAALTYKLRFRPKPSHMYQPPALFTETGIRITRAAPVIGEG